MGIVNGFLNTCFGKKKRDRTLKKIWWANLVSKGVAYRWGVYLVWAFGLNTMERVVEGWMLLIIHFHRFITL